MALELVDGAEGSSGREMDVSASCVDGRTSVATDTLRREPMDVAASLEVGRTCVAAEEPRLGGMEVPTSQVVGQI